MMGKYPIASPLSSITFGIYITLGLYIACILLKCSFNSWHKFSIGLRLGDSGGGGVGHNLCFSS